MKELSLVFFHSEREKQYRILIAHICNITLITLFLMVSTSIDNVVSEKMDSNGYQQIIAILGSVISVSVITIFFFQWVIAELFAALYESRRYFNIQMRLTGVSKYKLYKLYFAELLLVQLKAIPLGSIFAFCVYAIIASAIDLPYHILNMESMLLAITLHLLTVFFTTTISLVRKNRFSAIELWRGKKENGKYYRIAILEWIKALAGMLLLIAVQYLEQKTPGLGKLLILIVIILLKDICFILFTNIIKKIITWWGWGSGILAQSLNRYNYHRIRALMNMMIFGIVMTAGLQATYLSIRTAVGLAGERNIHYDQVITLQKPVSFEKMKSEKSLGLLNFSTSSDSFSEIHIQGINEEFLEKYETIDLNDALVGISGDELKRKIDDKDWNGIIFPQSYVSDGDIGKLYHIFVNGQDIEFEIEGGYYTNDYSKFRCLVGNAFLEKVIDMDGRANIIFMLKSENNYPYIENYALKESKEQIIESSVSKVLKSTELIELAVAIIFLCSLLMLINYSYILSKEKRMDYVKLRAIGLSPGQICMIFVTHFGEIIAFSFLVALPGIGIFANAACKLTLSSYYFTDGIKYPGSIIFWEIGLLISLPVLVFIACMIKVEKYVYLELRSMTSE